MKTKQCWHQGWSFAPTLKLAADVVSGHIPSIKYSYFEIYVENAEPVGDPIYTARMLNADTCRLACYLTTPSAGTIQRQLDSQHPCAFRCAGQVSCCGACTHS